MVTRDILLGLLIDLHQRKAFYLRLEAKEHGRADVEFTLLGLANVEDEMAKYCRSIR